MSIHLTIAARWSSWSGLFGYGRRPADCQPVRRGVPGALA